MGLYIRRSIKIGPIRLNFGKDGVGISAGVKGARVGITPRGRSYFHGGRYGLYYRQWLNKPGPAPISLPGIYEQGDQRPIESAECSCEHGSDLHIWSEHFQNMACTRCGCSRYHAPFQLSSSGRILLLVGSAIGIALVLVFGGHLF